MTTKILFRCSQTDCSQAASLTLAEIRAAGVPLCPTHEAPMQTDVDPHIGQAVDDLMDAMTRLTVAALRGTQDV